MRTYKTKNTRHSTNKGPRSICHARPGKYYISGVRTVPQTLSDATGYWG